MGGCGAEEGGSVVSQVERHCDGQVAIFSVREDRNGTANKYKKQYRLEMVRWPLLMVLSNAGTEAGELGNGEGRLGRATSSANYVSDFSHYWRRDLLKCLIFSLWRETRFHFILLC